jgi:hypothetical protein
VRWARSFCVSVRGVFRFSTRSGGLSFVWLFSHRRHWVVSFVRVAFYVLGGGLVLLPLPLTFHSYFHSTYLDIRPGQMVLGPLPSYVFALSSLFFL